MATVFYSWQSDTAPETNRHFLKVCLNDALKMLAAGDTLEEVIRGEELHLDHDTKGVFGDVGVLDTILSKIRTCDLFVADITVVAKTVAGKQCPNPNVLLELGYALDTAGPERTLKVMNEHYGAAKDGLPFDMAHKRFPCSYTLAPDAEAAEMTRVQKKLTKELAVIISGMLLEAGPKWQSELEFKCADPVWKQSNFIADGLLGTDSRSAFGGESTKVIWRNGPQWFLRVIPHEGLPAMTGRIIMDHLNTNKLLPLGDSSGGFRMTNSHGGVCYDIPVGEKPLRRFTQLFSNGEIWGVERPTEDAQARKIIAFAVFTQSLIKGLEMYLAFMRDQLGVAPPLQIIAGLSAITGYRIADRRLGVFSMSDFSGGCPKDEVTGDAVVIDTYDVSAEDMLAPFFQKVWEEFELPGSWRSE